MLPGSKCPLLFLSVTKVYLIRVNVSASLSPPTTTSLMAVYILHFHVLSGVLLLPSIYSATAWPSGFLWAALYSNSMLQTTDGKLKMSLRIRPWHAGQNQPTFSVLQRRCLHISLLSLPPQLFISFHYLYCCSFFPRAVTHCNSFSFLPSKNRIIFTHLSLNSPNKMNNISNQIFLG